MNDLIDSSLSDLKICEKINELIDGRYAFLLINEMQHRWGVQHPEYLTDLIEDENYPDFKGFIKNFSKSGSSCIQFFPSMFKTTQREFQSLSSSKTPVETL